MPGVWRWKHFASSTSFPGASGKPMATGGFCCASAVDDALSSAIRIEERNEVIFADALKNEEVDRGVAAVGDEVRAPGLHGVALAGGEAHFLLRLLHEDAQVALQDVEGVRHLVVVVPGHFLRLG